MWKKLKSTGLTLPASQQEYDDRKKFLKDKCMNKLVEYGMADSTQVDDDEDKMPKNYTEYKEKLEQEERLEFDSYQHFSFLP